MIIRGGENISPREIEDYLRLMDNVEDVAVKFYYLLGQKGGKVRY